METEALHLALDVLAEVGTFVRRIRNELRDDDVVIKSDGSPVTAADLAAECLVALALMQDDRVPPLPICGEESPGLLKEPGREQFRARVHQLVGSVDSRINEDDVIDLLDRGSFRPEPGSRSTHWICDPIDGTKRYLSGHRYSSCLGLVIDGELCAGALVCPDLGGGKEDPLNEPDREGSLFGASLGQGAFRVDSLVNGGGGERCPLRISKPEIDTKVLRVARSVGGSTLGSRLREQLTDAGFDPIPVNIDNQCKYAALATDRVDVLFQFGETDESKCSWDFAPGELIARAAGAEVMDRYGARFDFDQGPLLLANRGLRACRPDLIELLLSVR